MGMFDWIKFQMDCPKCGTMVDGFQSKDGLCCLAELAYWEVDNFYSSCKKCGAWIEFTLKKPKDEIPLSDYQMDVTEK